MSEVVNHIQKIRDGILDEIGDSCVHTEHAETFISPSEHFQAVATPVSTNNNRSNVGLTKVEVYSTILNDKIFDFFVNEEFFFHGWVTTADVEYLICAEDIFGGQTVIDLTNN
ncbi:hypothetical protein BEL04_09545 [Mucilaginibacter sp. PPCGB 2223]|uniref:hypothetical protein n=1 Tax=Mucilaginibacter sp. PPCGB 2223 TaxID=1886027 RepID=UPI0008260290|nr:hypothetical protein [Mucilaginibacter sp. PPCGB 2223]OCX54472.1 hypothetical protein BEL04_09545 [Mucilaginibacter sp. PPCGB 2223]